MANSSKRLAISALVRLYQTSPKLPSIPTVHPHPLPIPRHLSSSPSSANALLSRLLSSPSTPRNLTSKLYGRISPPAPITRHFSSKIGRSTIDKPVAAVKSAVARYREAVGLQIEAFWNRNYLIFVGAGAIVVCIALWRIMFGIASTFVGLSEGIAKYGFLALAAAIVSFTVSGEVIAIELL